jgi:hypothetical protein
VDALSLYGQRLVSGDTRLEISGLGGADPACWVGHGGKRLLANS